ncbi:MAG: DoxX family protein [Chloroflexi bacterium]|nr:DoxX family protein [Chloroflexota bacterium]
MADLGLFFLRLVIGGLFMAHGYPKLLGGREKPLPAAARRVLGEGYMLHWNRGVSGTGESFANMGVPAPRSMAVIAGFTQFLGGLGVLLGWQTRLAALAIAANMATATFIKARGGPTGSGGVVGPGGCEFQLTLLAASTALALVGPGEFSVDGR